MRKRPARVWHDDVQTATAAHDVERAVALVDEGWTAHVVSDPTLVRATVHLLPEELWQSDAWLLTALACSFRGSSHSVERATSTLYFTEVRRLIDTDHTILFEREMETRFCLVTDQRRRGRFARALSELDDLALRLASNGEGPLPWRLGMDARVRLERSVIDWHRAAFESSENPLGPALALAESRMVPSEQVNVFGTAALYALLSESYEQVDDWSRRAIEAAAGAETADDPSEVPLFESPALAPAVFALVSSRLERGDFDGARELIPPLERLSLGGEWRTYAALLDSMRLLLLHRPADALEPLRLARQRAHRWTDARMMERLSFALRIGIEAALGRVHSSELELTLEPVAGDPRHVFCTARYMGWLFVTEGRYAEAVESVAQCVRLGDRHARGTLTDVLLVEATALTASGEILRGDTSFDYALALCAESGFRRAFHHVPPPALASMLASAATRPQPDAVQALLAELAESLGAEESALPRLSEREVEIVRNLTEGSSLREVAQRLYISPNTLKTHVRHIYRKLGVGSRAEAVRAARHLGITPLSPTE